MSNLPAIDDLSKSFVANQFVSDLRNSNIDHSLIIDSNTFGKQNRYIGSPVNHFYPEIVIWKPTTVGSNTGKAVAAAVVETIDSLDKPSIEKWRFLSSINILFYLLVPSTKVTLIKTLLDGYSINNVILLSYVYNGTTKRYDFTANKI